MSPVLWAAGCGPTPGCSCDAGFYCAEGVVARSEDLGRTWTLKSLEVGVGSIAFATREDGWTVGKDGMVFRTRDAGSTWTRKADGIELPGEATERRLLGFDAVRFIDERRGVIAGVGETDEVAAVFGGLIYRKEVFVLLTEDGGETWRPATVEGAHVEPNGAAGSLCFTESGIGLIAGRPTLLSKDGGRSWLNIDGRLPYFDWPHAECEGDETLWLGTTDFVRSDDGGETWRKLTPEALGFNCCGGAADFFTRSLGWSYADLLRRTEDGGSTWRLIETPPSPGAFSVLQFATSEVGVWAGNGGGWVTHDAGESWTATTIVPAERRFRIADLVSVE